MSAPVIIAGAGPGGLTLALALHQHNIPVHVYEAVSQLKPLGVGINVLPHAVRVLHALGLASALAELGIPTADLHYYNKHGQLIWAEPRGIAAGYSYPQYSVHRGQLQHLLYESARARLGDDCLHLDHTLEDWQEQHHEINARFRSRAGATHTAPGSCLIAADGIHSVARRILWPNEGPPLFAGRMLWRAVSVADPFLAGRTMIMAGHQNQKFVCYPISRAHEQRGAALINWVAERSLPDQAPPAQDWNRQVPKQRFAEHFAAWRFNWLDVPALIDHATAIYEYPLMDRDPLPQWSKQ